jgi:hypothetical protein
VKGWLPEILNNVPGADFLFRHHDEGTLDSGGDLPRNQVHIDTQSYMAIHVTWQIIHIFKSANGDTEP